MTDIQGTYTMFTEDLCKSWVYYSIEGDSEFWHMILNWSSGPDSEAADIRGSLERILLCGSGIGKVKYFEYD